MAVGDRVERSRVKTHALLGHRLSSSLLLALNRPGLAGPGFGFGGFGFGGLGFGGFGILRQPGDGHDALAVRDVEYPDAARAAARDADVADADADELAAIGHEHQFVALAEIRRATCRARVGQYVLFPEGTVSL